jgi:hypothetical protein
MDDAGGRAGAKEAYSADGVHLLRTTHQVQYQLSQMADQKANMLLGITFVIFTLALGQARSGGAVHLPILILGGAAFVAATLAVMAVLPSTVAPAPRSDSVANMLFFGAFSQLSEDEFAARMGQIAADHRAVYEAFARDIYQNGRVLARKKYRLIGYAYRVLLAGLVTSLAAFVWPFAAHLF